MDTFTTMLRILGSIARALLPKGKQLYAERSAGKAPDTFSADISHEIFNEALARLGAADPEQPWWKDALAQLGGAVIQPDWFKKPYVQEWLSKAEVKSLLKGAAQANLLGSTDHQESHERLGLWPVLPLPRIIHEAVNQPLRTAV